MARDLGELNREDYARYKDDVKKEGKQFFPYAMWHDTVMSLVVVVIIVALAAIWYFDADGVEPGLLGPWYTEPADPGTTDFIPRPDWYFYFLFYLLRIFKWPESVILGTVGIPTLALVLLLALPFLDVRRERRVLRRPVALVGAILTVLAMGVLTYKGATARESIGSELLVLVPEWAEKQGFTGNEDSTEGAEIFAKAGCANCHTYLGAGTANVGAPDLTDIGAGGRNADYFVRYVANPAEFGNTVMPPFEQLGEENLQKLATFLVASKGSE
jgi:menaquinol-cytochrome c reductase cytochrome b/c subunit